MEYTFYPNLNESVDEWKSYLTEMYSHKQHVILNINLTKCTNFNIEKILKLKKIVDSFRNEAKFYLLYTVIIVSDSFIKQCISYLIPLFNPEKPVYVNIATN